MLKNFILIFIKRNVFFRIGLQFDEKLIYCESKDVASSSVSFVELTEKNRYGSGWNHAEFGHNTCRTTQNDEKWQES